MGRYRPPQRARCWWTTTGGDPVLPKRGRRRDALTGSHRVPAGARPVDAVQAAVAGAWPHGRAGDLLDAEPTQPTALCRRRLQSNLPLAIREISE
ncbi:MAG: hypothetical protein ACLSHO_10945 [Dysosmobacter sp.]